MAGFVQQKFFAQASWVSALLAENLWRGWLGSDVALAARTACVVLVAGPAALRLRKADGGRLWQEARGQVENVLTFVQKFTSHLLDRYPADANAFLTTVATPARLLPWLASVSQALVACWPDALTSESRCTECVWVKQLECR